MRLLFLFAAFFTVHIPSITGIQNTMALTGTQNRCDSSTFDHSRSSDGKRVVVLGGGVTGAWAAAKIAAHLKSTDELWIVAPPEQDLIKDLGDGVSRHYTTSAFTPIGIQIEMGAITLEPPIPTDAEKAKSLKQYDINAKLYISQDLDLQTQNKLDRYIKNDASEKFNRHAILTRYHRDVCYKEWQKYIEEGGKGVDFDGTIILSDNVQALESLREKILHNRASAGYADEAPILRVLSIHETAALLPRYSQLIENKGLNGLFGLNYDGRVKSTEVSKALNTQLESGPAKIIRVCGWAQGLQTIKGSQDALIVTGVKLRNGDILSADVVVSALGQGAEEVLKSAHLHLPILKKWGVVYSLAQDQKLDDEECPTILMRGLGIVRDLPTFPINCGLGEWILPEGTEPDATLVREFVGQSRVLWENVPTSQRRALNYPIYVQCRPMTLDGLPVLDSRTQGLVLLNPSGSQGNTQAPGSALFAASKVLEQLGREIPEDLQLASSVDWTQFELYRERF